MAAKKKKATTKKSSQEDHEEGQEVIFSFDPPDAWHTPGDLV